MKKRMLALLLVLCMVFVLCACGGGTNGGDDDDVSINKGGSSLSGGSDDDDYGGSSSYSGGSSAAADTSEAVTLTKSYLNAYLSGDAEGMYDAANWDTWYDYCIDYGTLSRSSVADKSADQVDYYQSIINNIGEVYGGGWYYSFEITDIKEVSQANVDDWNETIYDMCGYECTASCVIEFTFTIEGDNGATDTYEANAQWFYVGGVWMLPFDY